MQNSNQVQKRHSSRPLATPSKGNSGGSVKKVDINNDYYQSLGATGTPYFIDVQKD
ncbi:MAG: hypothetical protein M1579_03475 [Gammaproteobacteria bacterium]|nr:hypothetical protein [Gammaproteobacteria bacterium]